LIWYNDDRTTSLPDLSLAVFSHYQKSKQINWSESGQISLDDSLIKTDISGNTYNYFSSLTGRHTEIDTLSLEAATQKPNRYFKNKVILIKTEESRVGKECQ